MTHTPLEKKKKSDKKQKPAFLFSLVREGFPHDAFRQGRVFGGGGKRGLGRNETKPIVPPTNNYKKNKFFKYNFFEIDKYGLGVRYISWENSSKKKKCLVYF